MAIFTTNCEYWQLGFSKGKRYVPLKQEKNRVNPFSELLKTILKLELTLSFECWVSEENTEVDGWLTILDCTVEMTHINAVWEKIAGSLIYISWERHARGRCSFTFFICTTESRASLNLFIFRPVLRPKALLAKNNWIKTENVHW